MAESLFAPGNKVCVTPPSPPDKAPSEVKGEAVAGNPGPNNSEPNNPADERGKDKGSPSIFKSVDCVNFSASVDGSLVAAQFWPWGQFGSVLFLTSAPSNRPSESLSCK